MNESTVESLEREYNAACDTTNARFARLVLSQREYDAAHAASQRLYDRLADARRRAAAPHDRTNRKDQP